MAVTNRSSVGARHSRATDLPQGAHDVPDCPLVLLVPQAGVGRYAVGAGAQRDGAALLLPVPPRGPSEAVMLREADLYLPKKGWGRIVLAASASRAGTAWTDDGTARQERGLKHRADNETRTIPIPPDLVRLLRAHIRRYCTTRTGGSSRPAGAGSSRTPPTEPCGPRPASRRSPRRSAAPRSAAVPTTCGIRWTAGLCALSCRSRCWGRGSSCCGPRNHVPGVRGRFAG
jgi:hypothetical protein